MCRSEGDWFGRLKLRDPGKYGSPSVRKRARSFIFPHVDGIRDDSTLTLTWGLGKVSQRADSIHLTIPCESKQNYSQAVNRRPCLSSWAVSRCQTLTGLV